MPSNIRPMRIRQGDAQEQACFFVHRDSFRQGSAQVRSREEAVRGGSWEQGSVVSAPRVAACPPPECQAELGAREARGEGS